MKTYPPKFTVARQTRTPRRPLALEVTLGMWGILFVWGRRGQFWFVPKFCTHRMGPLLGNFEHLPTK